MFEKAYTIVSSQTQGTIEDMCLSVLSQIDNRNILKISFFGKAQSNDEYLQNISTIRNSVQEYYHADAPLISYIAQETATQKLLAEITLLTDGYATVERHRNFTLLRNGEYAELITGGIIPDDMSASTYEQANCIFKGIEKMLQSNGFKPSDIYRQWNYIQGITMLNDGSQNYQEFNDARSIFYNKCEWDNGYPAATGIGADAGGVVVEVNAIKCNERNLPIDNPLQIAAHNYSQDVLDGKVIDTLNERTTPKFERARLLGNTIFISGTAAIKGEHSLNNLNTVEQTAETMGIMDRLVSKENIPTANNGSHYDLLRIYVKRSEDIEPVRDYMNVHYPETLKHYLVADVCRPELLVEIEGIAHI